MKRYMTTTFKFKSVIYKDFGYDSLVSNIGYLDIINIFVNTHNTHLWSRHIYYVR
jgi:hypothetical protein